MASSYFKSAPLRIFNSNLISTFLSVGLHGLALFLLVPYLTNLPTSEPEVSDKGPINVPLLELNPNEQNRLPDQNSGLSTMPEFPNSSLGELPMLDSPSLGSSLPNNINNLPTPPALPPLPPLPSYNNYSRIPIALPPRRSFPPRSSSLPQTPLPPPPLKTPTEKTLPTPNTETPNTPDPRQNIPFGDPTPSKPNNPVFRGPNTRNPRTNPPLSVRPNNINRQDEIDRRLLEDTLKGADNLIYNPEGTKREEARRRDLEWMQQTGVTLKPSQMMTIRATYPKAACNLKLEGTAIYNVLVNSNGQLRRPPFLTQSSGYGLLNNQGLAQVRARSFPQSTRVKVIFKYDSKICGTGVVEKESNTQPQPSPSPQTTPNQTPKAPPETKTPDNSNNTTPTTQPSPAPETPENQTPSTPDNSNNTNQKSPSETVPPTQPSPAPETPENQTPSTPDNSNNTNQKSPSETKPDTQPSPTPEVPENRTPSTPDNSNNPIPKSPPKPKPATQPSPAPEVPKNRTPSVPTTPNTPAESNPNSNSSSTNKLDGVVAPPARRK